MADISQTPGDQEPRSSKTPLIIGIIIVLLVVGYAIAKKSNNSQPTTEDQNTTVTGDTSGSMDMTTPAPQPAPETTTSSTPTSTPSTATNAGEKTFTVKGQNYSFSPSEIRVNKGDKVKIVFENSGGFHDFALDEFNVLTPTIPSGQTATVEFTADKTGTFEYYCSVANHRQMGMVGKFIVQ